MPSYSSVCPRGESPDPKIKPASWVAFVAPPNLDLAVLTDPPLDQLAVDIPAAFSKPFSTPPLK